jgi:hypothetical protein
MNQVVRAVFTIPTNMLENKLRNFGKPLGLPTLFVVEDILLVPEDDLAAKILKIMRADQSENVALQSVDQRLELQISQLGAKLMQRHLRKSPYAVQGFFEHMVYGWQMQVCIYIYRCYIYIYINNNNINNNINIYIYGY